jgi:hypothetical protein
MLEIGRVGGFPTLNGIEDSLGKALRVWTLTPMLTE